MMRLRRAPDANTAAVVVVREVSPASIAITTEYESSSTNNSSLRERKNMEVCVRLSNRLFVR